jgi:hypothetical protein
MDEITFVLGEGTEYEAFGRVICYDGDWSGYFTFKDERFSPSEPEFPQIKFRYCTPYAPNGVLADTRARRQYDFIVGVFKAISANLKAQIEERDQLVRGFIDEAWSIASDGALGNYDYPAQVLRHLKEMKEEKDAKIAELRGLLDGSLLTPAPDKCPQCGYLDHHAIDALMFQCASCGNLWLMDKE